MSTVSETQKNALASKLNRLAKRVDTKVVDDIFDEILKQIGALKTVSLAVRSSEWAKREVSPHGDHVEFELPVTTCCAMWILKTRRMRKGSKSKIKCTLHLPDSRLRGPLRSYEAPLN
jgi:hypothetical protein